MHRCYCTAPGHCQWRGIVTTKEEFASCQNGKPPPERNDRPCIYLGELKNDCIDGLPAYACNLHGRCTIRKNESAQPACDGCGDKLLISDSELAKKFRDPLRVTDRSQSPTSVLQNFLFGGSAFLVCGGPSVNRMNFERLRERGIFSLGVNNVAGKVPVTAFVCSDPPMKFHWGIFKDPKVMKFLPTPKIGKGKNRGRLRIKHQDGTFQWLNEFTCECPNVWGFERRSWLMVDHTFFTEPSASWGNQNAGVERTGLAKTACTMLLGIRLLHYLGAANVFLLGADFWMSPGAGPRGNYAFGQDRDKGAVESNNRQFGIAAEWLQELRPVFERFGFHVYNCNRESALRAFDHVPFEDALESCRGIVPEEPFDLSDWYEKKETKGAGE